MNKMENEVIRTTPRGGRFIEHMLSEQIQAVLLPHPPTPEIREMVRTLSDGLRSQGETSFELKNTQSEITLLNNQYYIRMFKSYQPKGRITVHYLGNNYDEAQFRAKLTRIRELLEEITAAAKVPPKPPTETPTKQPQVPSKRQIAPTPTEKPTEQTQFQQRANEYCIITSDSDEMLSRNKDALTKYGISLGEANTLTVNRINPQQPKFLFLAGPEFITHLKSKTPNTLKFFCIIYESNVFSGTVGHIVGGLVTNTHIVLLHHYISDRLVAADAKLKEWLTTKGITKNLVIYPPTSEYNLQKSDIPIQGKGACQRWYIALPYLISKHLSNGKPYAEQTEDEKTETHRKWAALGTDWTLVKPLYDEINKKPTDVWFKISQSGELVGMGRRKTRRRITRRRKTRRS